MSEQILKALMQLFAIIARPGSNREDRRVVVESFLKRQLNQELVDVYLKIFDDFYNVYQERQKDKESRRRRISASSVKVLKICTEINKFLEQQQKFIVLIQLLEFVKSDINKISDQELEFIDTVADTFNITKDEYTQIKDFVLFDIKKVPNSPAMLIINNLEIKPERLNTKHMKVPGLIGEVRVLNVHSANMYFIMYLGTNEINLNGQLIEKEKKMARLVYIN
jgi:hypothetical protein